MTVWWISSDPLVSSTNKTDRHDITEILLIVNQTNKHYSNLTVTKIFSTYYYRLDPGKHLHSFIRPADVTGENLGSRPRSRYPAIVISVVENTADIMSRSDSQIVSTLYMFLNLLFIVLII